MVAIIGVLAAVAIPAYNGYRTNAAESSVQAEATAIIKALQACIAIDTVANCYTTTVKNTISKTCTTAPGTAPATNTVGCFIDLTTDGCVSSHTTSPAGDKSYCITVDNATGATTSTANQWCKNDGTCN